MTTPTKPPTQLPPELSAAVADIAASELSEKTWWKSKTLWVNLIAFGAAIIQTKNGFFMDPGLQMMALALVNKWLRSITKDKITW